MTSSKSSMLYKEREGIRKNKPDTNQKQTSLRLNILTELESYDSDVIYSHQVWRDSQATNIERYGEHLKQSLAETEDKKPKMNQWGNVESYDSSEIQ